MIHIDVDESCISRNVRADLAINADAGWAIRRLLEETEAGSFPAWKEQIRRWQGAFRYDFLKKRTTGVPYLVLPIKSEKVMPN